MAKNSERSGRTHRGAEMRDEEFIRERAQRAHKRKTGERSRKSMPLEPSKPRRPGMQGPRHHGR